MNHLSNLSYFILHANCIVVEGVKRSLICDLQWGRTKFIPNELFPVISLLNQKTINDIKLHFNNEMDSGIDTYIRLLANEEWGVFIENPKQFPKLSLQWDFHGKINNAIIDIKDYNRATYINNFTKQIEKLGCEGLLFRFFSPIEVDFLTLVLDTNRENNIAYIEILMPYTDSLTDDIIIDIFKKNYRLRLVTIFNAPFDRLFFYENKVENIRIVYTQENPTNNHYCGFVDFSFFALNIEHFTESQQHNTCLNRKISIDAEGNIKNCPSMTRSFGHISDTRLEDVIRDPEFTKYWYINKDQIKVCQDCEFRHICTDCRAYRENPDDLYSKPLKCGYNPYTCEWEEWSTNPLKQKAIEQYGMSDMVASKPV